MRIFTDRNLTQEIQLEDIHLGIVPAGETKKYSFWLLNNTNAVYRLLEFTCEHEEIEIIRAPKEIFPQASEELVIQWNCSVTLEEPLRTIIRINGKRHLEP